MVGQTFLFICTVHQKALRNRTMHQLERCMPEQKKKPFALPCKRLTTTKPKLPEY